MMTPPLYEQLWEKRLIKITKNSKPTHVGIDKLESQCEEIAAAAKTHSYTQGQKYGHIADIITESKYRILINNATWVHVPPVDPGVYAQAELAARESAAVREQYVTYHKILQDNNKKYLVVKEVMKDIIEYAVGSSPIAALNSLTPIGAPMRQLFFSAWQKCRDFTNFGPPSQPNT